MLKALAALLTLFVPCLAHARNSVLLIGDSITNGVVRQGPLDPEVPSYADLLTESLSTQYDVVNAGCGGSTSANWLPFASSTVCDFTHPTTINLFVDRVFPADIATIMLGTNDANFSTNPPAPADEYRYNMTGLVDALLYVGVANVILMSAPPRPEVETPNIFQDGNPAVSAALSQYRGVVFDICASHENVYCIDVHASLSADTDSYFFSDFFHPNAAAHALIHDVLREQILSIPEP